MRQTPEESGESDFDLWKLDRDSREEAHQAEFALKYEGGKSPMDFGVDGDHSEVVALLERATGGGKGRGAS
ncbi:MAG TPA: hypothetical protein VGA48_08500 [Thermoplasmata archaeon]